jgi:nitrous oxide reductase
MTKEKDNLDKEGLTRRDVLGGSVKLTALAGVGAMAGLVGMTPKTANAASSNKAEVSPGDLDEYYGFWSSGQAGEMRCCLKPKSISIPAGAAASGPMVICITRICHSPMALTTVVTCS